MTKAPLAFRTISEVSETLDVPQHVLRFWEGKFPQIKPLKRAGGRRYYRPEDIELLRGVRTLLYAEGYTIKGVQKVLRDSGPKHVCEIGRFGPQRNGRAETSLSLEDAQAHLPESELAESGDVDDLIDSSIGDGERDSVQAASDDGIGRTLGARRQKLEAALAELLSLRDLLRAARPKAADAA